MGVVASREAPPVAIMFATRDGKQTRENCTSLVIQDIGVGV